MAFADVVAAAVNYVVVFTECTNTRLNRVRAETI